MCQKMKIFNPADDFLSVIILLYLELLLSLRQKSYYAAANYS
jgi:hypothetical protein